MKRNLTIFLRVIILLIAIGTLAFMIWEPRIEGRNIHATLFEIYFEDPFLVYAYIASLPFFLALYQAFAVLGYIRRDKAFSQKAVKAVGIIRYCAITIIGFVAVGVIFIRFFSGSDDCAGGVFMGVLITFGSIMIATAAAIFERFLQDAADIKSKKDSTV